MTPHDEASGKGSVGDDGREPNSVRNAQQVSYTGQLGHRDEDPMLKDNDTDFPEPDAEAEHTGE
ncbi:MAG: hypothetical protein ABR910_10190 [Acidobacteriaceae bacterium]|jgi:hypothetical protein